MEKKCTWQASRFLRGSMLAGEGDCVTLLCPPEGLDYLLYDRTQDTDFSLPDYACLLLTVRALHENSQCFQWAFYEKDQAERCV